MSNEQEKNSDTITIGSTGLPEIDLGTFSLPSLDTIDISSLTYSSTMSSGFSNGSYTIANTNSGLWSSAPVYTTNPGSGITNSGTLTVKGDAEFDGDIKVKGRSLMEMIEKIESRLAILRPDPEKLEHFEALKKAYENYKTLERLCQLEDKDDK